jgi:hypothetical protein
LLDPMAIEVWPKPDLHGAAEPDFLVRRIDNSYLVVEIEKPSKSLVTSAKQLSAEATQAVTQALHYRGFLVERFAEAARSFPSFQVPECLVVIGMECALTAEQKRRLLLENENRPFVRIAGFDWIADRARMVTRNVVEGRMDVRKARML